MKQQPTSKQQNRTKKHLTNAFITLIKEKGYHAISVKDIVHEADYNRSTFYVHYQDKIQLAEELLNSMLSGLEQSVGLPYTKGQKLYSSTLNTPSFNIIAYIYEHRDFFNLIMYEDTLPGLHLKFPAMIQKIYDEQFEFQTINNLPVNMAYFKRYTAQGFYGLITNWIATDFKASQEEFIKEVINLTRTHIYSFQYLGIQQ